MTTDTNSPIAFGVILPAAGVGSRSGADIPKQFVEIHGQTVLGHTLDAFMAIPECVQVVIALDPFWVQRGKEIIAEHTNVQIVEGGSERQDSIHNALEVLAPELDTVLVHDAARPLVSKALIYRILAAVSEHGAAIPGLPVTETLKQVDEHGNVVQTIPRKGLYTVQTPQGFRADLLRHAYANSVRRGLRGTDDATLVEQLGEKVVVVDGEPENLKITWAEDFAKASEFLQNRASRSA